MISRLFKNWELLASVLGLSLLLSACPSVNDPKTPPPADQPDPQGRFFSHFMQLSWSGQDLLALNSLQLRAFQGVRKIDAGDKPTLSILLRLDVQIENHQALANRYFEKIASESHLAGNSPRIILNPPENSCQETPDFSDLKGVCVRELVLAIPRNLALPIDIIPSLSRELVIRP